jgi:protein-tyrosine phosphatase
MNHLIKKNNLENLIETDSAGTIAYHTGESADERMIRHAKKRGYNLTSLARKFNPEKDFDNFDYIVTMDNENYYNIKILDPANLYSNKVFKMVEFSKSIKAGEVPDPYYSGSAGFELVLDILEDACQGLLEKIKNDIESEEN